MKLLLFLLLLLLLVPIVQSQDTACVPAASFRYDANADIFTLINADGAILQTYPNIHDYISQGHSPDCRFVVATLKSGSERDTTVWNASTGEQLQTFEGALGRLYSIYWSPDSEGLIASTRSGHFLWNFYSDESVQITDLDGWWLQLYWDTSRHEVFILPYTLYYSSGEVLVYNWLSAARIANYTSYLNRDNYNTSKSTFAVRGNFVIVAMYALSTNNTPVTVWDRTSHEVIVQLNGGAIGIVPSYHYAGTANLVDVSPDGRYIAVADWTLRVWDMNSLAENYEDRTANYQYHLATNSVNAVHFIDNTTVEILLDDNITRIRMNILTGEIIE